MVDYSKTLGFAGAGYVDGVQVLLTGQSFDKAYAPSFLEAYSVPNTIDSRSRIKHADGTVSYSGSISWDITAAQMTSLFTTAKLLCRNYEFDVEVYDGEDSWKMEDCKATSLSLSGQPGGLVSCSLSFAGKKEWGMGGSVPTFVRDSDVPLGYWYSGNTDVRDWTFTFNQDVTPRYGNVDSMEPMYLLCGLVTLSLQVTTYNQIHEHSQITIATSSFTLTGVTSSKGYQFGGVSDLGMYSHTFETAASASDGSGGVIIS